MRGASRAVGTERSAVNELSSLISEQSVTVNREQLPNYITDHFPTSSRWITAMGVENILWERKNWIYGSWITAQAFSK